MGGTAISALTTVKLVKAHGADPVSDHRAIVSRSTRVIAVLVLRDAPAESCRRLVSRRAWSATPAAGHLAAAALYAVGFGGYVAFSVYLPTYLKNGYGLTPAGRRQPDGRVRVGGGDHAARRRLALRPDRPRPRARGGFAVVAVLRASPRSTRPRAARRGRVPGHGRRTGLRRSARCSRSSPRSPAPAKVGRRHRPGRRRRWARRLRPAAGDGRHLRRTDVSRSGWPCFCHALRPPLLLTRHCRPPYHRRSRERS